MQNDDGWDWPVLLYVGTVWLNMSEEKFWYETTPRKLMALAKAHVDLHPLLGGSKEENKTNTGVKKGFIDDIF